VSAAKAAGTPEIATFAGIPPRTIVMMSFPPVAGVLVVLPASSALPEPLFEANVLTVKLSATAGGAGGPLTVHGHGNVIGVVTDVGVKPAGGFVSVIVTELVAGETRCGLRAFEEVPVGTSITNCGVTSLLCGVGAAADAAGFGAGAEPAPLPPPHAASVTRARTETDVRTRSPRRTGISAGGFR